MTAQRKPSPIPDAVPEPGLPEQGNLVVVQEPVLAEIRHELGNLFHKLYYWSDYIKNDDEGGKKNDTTAGEMLERTISNLEEFLKVALEYFQPITLNFMKIGVIELVDGLMTHLQSYVNGNQVQVVREDLSEATTILIDPTRISQAFRIALHHIGEDLKSGGGVAIRLGRGTRQEFHGLEIRLEAESKVAPSSLFRGSAAGVEWAVAQRLIELHGGEIVEQYDESGRTVVTIFLPIYA